MKILIGTTSQLKMAALEEAITFIKSKKLTTEAINIDSLETESGVPSTPYESQTFQGAKNRAQSLQKEDADVFIGVESGLVTREGKMYEETWCFITDKNSKEASGVSSALLLTKEITDQLSKGRKHTEIINEIADKTKASHKETWGIYSNGSLSRSTSLFEAIRNALVSYLVQE